MSSTGIWAIILGILLWVVLLVGSSAQVDTTAIEDLANENGIEAIDLSEVLGEYGYEIPSLDD